MIDFFKLCKYVLIISLLVYLGYRTCLSFYYEGILDLINNNNEMSQGVYF